MVLTDWLLLLFVPNWIRSDNASNCSPSDRASVAWCTRTEGMILIYVRT